MQWLDVEKNSRATATILRQQPSRLNEYQRCAALRMTVEITMLIHTDEDTSRFITIDEPGLENFQLHYNDAGSGPAVIMLHGGGPGASGWSNFYKNIDHFVDHGFRVLLLDCPGFHKSDELVSDQVRPLLNARAVKGLMDGLGIERAHLLGNSLGGATALHFALEFPERLDRLVLMGPGGLGHSIMQANPQEGIRHMIKLYKQPSYAHFESMLEVFVYNPAAITEELRQGRWANSQARPNHLSNFLRCVALSPIATWDMMARAHQIQHPTLITWGRDDRFVPIDHGLRLLHTLGKAELHVFSQCGHWAQWEHAPAFNELVINFLKRA